MGPAAHQGKCRRAGSVADNESPPVIISRVPRNQRPAVEFEGAKGVGESATVGAPPAIVNAVVDALSHLGVTHIDIPITPPRLWRILSDKGVAL